MTFVKKHIKLFAILLVLAAICACLALFTRKESSDLRTIKVAQFGDVFIYTPLYLADIKGYFAEEGLKIELINTGGDDKTYAAVIGGSASFGIADPVFAAIAQEKGIDGRVIGGIVNGVPFWAITKKDIPQITDGKMLEPYSVATYSAPSTAYTVQKKMFQDAGLWPNIKQGAFGGLIPMLDAGQADIALELEPNVSTAAASGSKVVYSFVDRYPEFAFTGITTSLKTINKEPELVQHFINAITKAEAYAHNYPDSAAFYMCRVYPSIDAEIIHHAIGRMVESESLPQNAIISDDAWKAAVDLRYQIGDLQSTSNTDFVLDMSFAINALKAIEK